jgi:Putative auto-transporter adhesin, head GIN domain
VIRRAVLLSVAALAAVAAGCGSGPMTEQPRELPDFARVRSEGSIDVLVRAGAPNGVVVRAGEKVIDDVRTEVVGDTLVVNTDSRGLVIGPDGFDDARVLVGIPRLRGAEVEGSSDIELAGLTGGALDIDVQGSGDVEARGRVDSLEAHVQGSGDADLGDLAAARVAVGVEGSGDARVHPVDELRAVVEGSGSISYSGNPRVTLSRTDGSGDIERD